MNTQTPLRRRPRWQTGPLEAPSRTPCVPDYAPTGPREVRLSDYRSGVMAGALVVCGVLAAAGLAVDLADAGRPGALAASFGIVAGFFAIFMWLVWWRPAVQARRLVGEGDYAVARIHRIERPWWSEMLRVLKILLCAADRTALLAEVGYRVTLELEDDQGRTRRLRRILWRSFQSELPRGRRRVGVFYDPARDDRFVMAQDLEHRGIEVIEGSASPV